MFLKNLRFSCLFLGSILLSIAVSGRAEACSCAPEMSITEAFESGTAVFAGEVIEIEDPLIPTNSFNPRKVTFEVSEIWKGPLSKTIVITTPIGSASCGYEFQIGQSYLLYTTGQETSLNISSCNRIRSYPAALADLANLKNGKTPEATLPPSQIVQWGLLAIPFLLCLGAGIFLLVIIYLTNPSRFARINTHLSKPC